MKRIFLVLFAMLPILNGYAQDFTVHNYSVEIFIHQEGYFDVVENYDLNFETYKHGIYRTIQTNYDLVDEAGNAQKRRIKISDIEVPKYKFDAPFDFVQKLSDKIDIKIGDKNKTLIGPQHYEISYRVYNAFLFRDSQIRFYWNIKPDGWQADFHQITFKVHVPDEITLSKETGFVYSGDRGTSTLSSDFTVHFDKGVMEGRSIENFVSHPGESVTVLINLPANAVKEIKPLWPFWNAYGWLFFVGALIIAFFLIWRKFGKDERVVRTTSYYAPENIDPAMAGFLIDDKADNADLISLLPFWGSKGYLRIEEVPKKGLFGKKDTKLIRIKPLPNEVGDYELKVFNGLFGNDQDKEGVEVLVSSLKDTFYSTMQEARSILKKKAQPYYVAESRKIQGITWAVLVFMAIVLTFVGLVYWGILAAIALLITCILLMILNVYMVKKNTRGNRTLSELKGFKQFIKIAEENKLKLLLEDDPSYFENTMGYALAFGMFDKWARKFEVLNVPPPQWYSSPSYNTLTMHNFSKSFSSSMAMAKSNMVSTPSSSGSSGGGSSGGGFGGGGGGSW
ncbi:MAG: DUF2207 domain-containing protein [Maribacter sp.]|uniref:DUF2207 domain-containing protein n=1 Tax=Maribacter sp. TaxID=1897614 RepID=UPI003C78B988